MKLEYNEIMYIYDGCALYLGECEQQQEQKALNYMCDILDNYGIDDSNPKPALKMLYNIRDYYKKSIEASTIRSVALFDELSEKVINDINTTISKLEKELNVKLDEDYEIEFC